MLNRLYQEYGGKGNSEVEFFELSDKNWDSNEDVKGFAQKHGLTFIGAGTDGGSLSAVAPYKSGTWGSWWGTPTFIIIEPNKKVHYRIPFGDVKSKIDEILEGGGPVEISGKVLDEDGAPLAGAPIYYSPDNSVVATTGPDGSYSFMSDEVNLVPNAFITTYLKQGNPKTGVSTKDIVVIQKHLLRIESFTQVLDLMASDVNGDQVVSAKDLLEIRKLILGKILDWTLGYSHVSISEDWFSGSPEAIHYVGYAPKLQSIIEGGASADFRIKRVGDIR